MAFVVPRADDLDVEELDAWLAERVASYKRPRAITLVRALPRTPAGKLLSASGGVEPLAHRGVMREVLA